MKKIITILLLFIGSISYGQSKTAKRHFGGCIIQYEYDTTKYSFKWEGTKKVVYYEATITVFDSNGKMAPIKGVYSPLPYNRMDDPEQWIKKAKNP